MPTGIVIHNKYTTTEQSCQLADIYINISLMYPYYLPLCTAGNTDYKVTFSHCSVCCI